MRFDPHQLRKWLLAAAGILVVVVLGFYVYARWRLHSIIRNAPARLGADVQRTSQGFALSKSEGGRTLFTIHAAKAVQFKEGGHAQLHDVNIVIYGKTGDRFDQISGADFEYDPQSGDVLARGEVQIDLEANAQGPSRPDQAPPKEQKNLIHVNTSGLVFNQKTGMAATKEQVEFRIPQAQGSAVGAVWDSHASLLSLQSAVVIDGTGPNPIHVEAQNAALTKAPRQAVLEVVHITQAARDFDANRLVVFLQADNRVDHMLATGDVRADEKAKSGEQYNVRAPEAQFLLTGENRLRSIVMQSGAVVDSTGPEQSHGSAQGAQVFFDDQQRASKIHAAGDVHFSQHQQNRVAPAKPNAHTPPGAAQPEAARQNMELIADAVDLFAATPGHAGHAETFGAARIELEPAPSSASKPTENKPPAGKTVVTAGKFNAVFDGKNRMRSLHGEPDARITSPASVAGAPPRVSSSQMLDVFFDQAQAGGVDLITQKGDLHYIDGARQAFADQGRYTPKDEVLLLTGSPRVQDEDTTTTAQVVRMNRATGDAFAEGDVKSTYHQSKTRPGGSNPQPTGAMLGSSDPIHVTAHSLAARKSTGVAQYSGDARLWQDANILESPIIDFQREHRSMTAQGSGAHPVISEFVQTDSKGKQTPVNVTSARFTYSDELRNAHYEGSVVMKSDQGTLTSSQLDIYLKPAQQPSTTRPSGPSQIDHAVAQGKVLLVQPGRRATGERLVYTADDQKFVLTGTPRLQPEVDDVQRGITRGDLLTFFRDQDKVLVQSASNIPTYTRTRVK